VGSFFWSERIFKKKSKIFSQKDARSDRGYKIDRPYRDFEGAIYIVYIFNKKYN
jgi:hypothetical protein